MRSGLRGCKAIQESQLGTASHLHDGQRGGRDGVGEVAARGGDGADDGDRALAVGRAQALDTAGALVKRGQTGAQVSRVACMEE